MRAKALVFLVPALMVLAAVAHGWRASKFEESPWIGAGFGMFAEVDGPQRVAVLEYVGGEIVIEPAIQSASLARGASFPSESELANVRRNFPRVVSIEIYRPAFVEGGVTWELVASHDD